MSVWPRPLYTSAHASGARAGHQGIITWAVFGAEASEQPGPGVGQTSRAEQGFCPRSHDEEVSGWWGLEKRR